MPIRRFGPDGRQTVVLHDIADIPFEEIEKELGIDVTAETEEQVLVDFIKRYNLGSSWKWLGPQLLAHLATYNVSNAYEEGLIDPLTFLKINVKNHPRERGLWRLITRVTRSKWMTKQTDKEHLPYCALVPLYMAAQKKFNNVPYSAWSILGLQYIVDHALYKAMLPSIGWPNQTTLDKQELIEIRNRGLEYASKDGSVKSYNPETYHMLRKLSDTILQGLPSYAVAMLTQIWCAHPSNRHQYMILNPWNWDEMPEPLISTQVLKSTYVQDPF